MGCCSQAQVQTTVKPEDEQDNQNRRQEQAVEQEKIPLQKEETKQAVDEKKKPQEPVHVQPKQPEKVQPSQKVPVKPAAPKYKNVTFSLPKDYPTHYCQIIPSTSRWICDKLSPMQKKMLDLLLDAATKLQGDVQVPSDIQLTVEEISAVSKALYQAYPELFYIQGFNYQYVNNYITSVQLFKPLPISNDDIAQMQLQLLQNVSKIIEFANDNQLDLCVAYCQHMSKQFKYSYTPLKDDGYFDYIHNAIGSLVHYQSVCQGVALGWLAVAFLGGIKSMYVPGTAINDDGPGPHSWNIIELDGKPYICDFTWSIGNCLYNYICAPDDIIAETHTIDKDFVAPKCIHWDKFYFKVNNQFAMLKNNNFEQLHRDVAASMADQFNKQNYAASVTASVFIFGIKAQEYRNRYFDQMYVILSRATDKMYTVKQYNYQKYVFTIDFTRYNDLPFEMQYLNCRDQSDSSIATGLAQQLGKQLFANKWPESYTAYIFHDGLESKAFAEHIEAGLLKLALSSDICYQRNGWSGIGSCCKFEIIKDSKLPFKYSYLDANAIPAAGINAFVESCVRAQIQYLQKPQEMTIFFTIKNIEPQELKAIFVEALYGACDQIGALYKHASTVATSSYAKYNIVKENAVLFNGDIVPQVLYYLSDQNIEQAKSQCRGRYTTWKLGEKHFKLQLQ